jgi:polygalacturonase
MRLILFLLCSLLIVLPSASNAQDSSERAAASRRVIISDFGAVGDGVTLNTEKIQSTIDQLAAKGGGTLVVPQGVFLTSSIFLKPGVNLYLDEGAVLKGSTNLADYPRIRTRIEGHFEDHFLPALVNADKCNNLRITGSGTLDGSGAPFWSEFWRRLKADAKTKNLDVLRPRLALIENSDGVQINGITFKNSAFWNLHLYRCKNLLVENVRFEVPDGVRCPSTDGTDIDSSQNITLRGCTYRVDDDCICLKGSKGPFAKDDQDSPPVEHIRVENCTFERGMGMVTFGSEATVVRDVVVENCRATGPFPVARLKLRPDTAQDYEDIHYRNITLAASQAGSGAAIIAVEPWMQYFDLKGQPRPKSVVKNVTISDVKGAFGAFGQIRGNPGQTEISDITLKNINVQLKNPKLNVGDVKNLKIENVIVNGNEYHEF